MVGYESGAVCCSSTDAAPLVCESEEGKPQSASRFYNTRGCTSMQKTKAENAELSATQAQNSEAWNCREPRGLALEGYAPS